MTVSLQYAPCHLLLSFYPIRSHKTSVAERATLNGPKIYNFKLSGRSVINIAVLCSAVLRSTATRPMCKYENKTLNVVKVKL